MNKKLLDSMREQMKPSPEIQAALSEKLARPVKKRPTPWKKYAALAACAALCSALVIEGFFLERCHPEENKRVWITEQFNPDVPDTQPSRLHSYVTAKDLTGSITENLIAEKYTTGTGDIGGEPVPNTGDLPNRDDTPSEALPGGAYTGDVPSQEEAVNAYQKLMERFGEHYPDWYGGAYIDSTSTLIVCLVEDENPGGKTLELQVLDWAGGRSSRVAFTDVKYALSHLHSLQEQVCDAMTELGLFAGCGTDEQKNRLDLTLTSVTDEALALLAQLDPDDDAIYVQVGQRASADLGRDVTTDSAMAEAENPTGCDVMPGGVTPPVRIGDDIPPIPEGGIQHPPETKQPSIQTAP